MDHQKEGNAGERTHVLSCNRTGYEADLIRCKLTAFSFRNQFIAGPQGEILAQLSNDKEENIR